MSTSSKPKTVAEDKNEKVLNQGEAKITETKITDISQLSPEVIAQIADMMKEKIAVKTNTETDKTEEATLSKSEADLAKEEKSMKARIMACPKEKIYIPKPTKDEDDRLAIVVNGVIFSVKKDVMVEVPKPVADIYNYSKSETNKAMAKIKVSNITDKNDLEID